MRHGVKLRAALHAEVCADGCAEKMAAMQKWIAETVQNLAPIGGAEKNGSDADEFAEEMQK